MTTTDSNGIVFLQDTDNISPFHTLINGLQTATSIAVEKAGRGPFYAADNTARDALLTQHGASSTNPLWVDVAGTLERNAGSGWIVVGWSDLATGAPTLSSGWTTIAGASYAPRLTRQADRVDLEGAVQRTGTTGALTSILTIPADFRPTIAGTHFVGTAATSAGKIVELALTSAGVLLLGDGYWSSSPAADSGFVLPIRASWHC